LVEFRFFVRLVNLLRAFVDETTTHLRGFRTWLGSVLYKYAALCCLPCMAIKYHHERGFKVVFRSHTEAFAG
jgi:hypothetical protein